MKKGFLVCLIWLFAGMASASEWSSNNIQLMQGSGFRVDGTGNDTMPDKHRTIFTFEHASGWRYGDNYYFFDVTNPDRKGTEIYGEWHPRLSLSKMSGRKVSWGPIKDTLLASQMNVFGGHNTNSGAGTRAYLWGIGFDWDIPKFSFFQSNFYVRKDTHVSGTTYQITLAWSLPFSIAMTDWRFEGFCDWIPKNYGEQVSRGGRKHANVLFEPQLLIDVGNLTFKSKDKLFVGIEYTYWNHKLGIQDESVASIGRTKEKALKWMIKFYL